MSSVLGDILVVNKINANALTSAKFKQVCRCCLSEGQTMFPIFKLDFKGISFSELLKRCSALKVEINDRLPQNVCTICVKKVVELDSFKEQCNTSENILKGILRREYLEYETDRILNKILVPMKEVESSEENNFQELKFYDEYLEDEESDLQDEYSENPSPVCINETDIANINETEIANINEIDIAKEEIIGQNCAGSEQNSDDIILENAVRKKQRKLRFRKKISNKQVKPTRPILPKVLLGIRWKKTRHLKFTCRVCKAVFRSKEDFRAHRIKEKHPLKENRLCKVCGTVIVFGKAKEHMKTHSALKLYECDICSKRFGFLNNLKRHKMLHTNERPHKCELCEKAFVQKVQLKAHIRVHTGEKPYVCHYCGKQFANNNYFKTHLRSVHEPKTDEAKEAQKAKKQDPSVKIVRKLQCDKDVQKNFICNHCDKRFASLTTLQLHQRVHTGERPYQCPDCPKRFAYFSSFKSHVMIHTGEKPYVCKVCNRAFTQSNQLKYHMRTHSGERPYVCPYCGKAFALNGNLTVHVRTHTGEKPYVCEFCEKGFYDASSLKKHKKSHSVDNN